jgi:TM2 domain-containing membrane protein YozV
MPTGLHPQPPERPRPPTPPPPRPPVMRSPVVRPPAMKPGFYGMPIAPPQYQYPQQRYAPPRYGGTPFGGGTTYIGGAAQPGGAVAMPVSTPRSQPVSSIPYPGLPASAPPVSAVHSFPGEQFSDRSGVVAGMLQLLLGWVGAGRMYTGHVGIALAQFGIVWVVALLTLCAGAATAEMWVLAWLGMAWPVVDGVILLCGGQRDRQGRRLR